MRTYHLDETTVKRLQGNHTIEELGSSRCRKCWGPRGCKQSTIEEIAKILGVKWWELLIERERKELENVEPPVATTNFPLLLSFREDPTAEKYFIEALHSEREVLHASVMSKRSFSILDKHLATTTQLNVLTWMPKSAHEIDGFAKHLNEQGDKIDQTKNALIEWDKRIEQSSPAYRENIKVWTYDSTPTLQGTLVKEGWALIELIPYDTKPLFRPGLLLRFHEEKERRAFNFFWDRFSALWSSSTRRKIGDIPDWTLDASRKHTAGAGS